MRFLYLFFICFTSVLAAGNLNLNKNRKFYMNEDSCKCPGESEKKEKKLNELNLGKGTVVVFYKKRWFGLGGLGGGRIIIGNDEAQSGCCFLGGLKGNKVCVMKVEEGAHNFFSGDNQKNRGVDLDIKTGNLYFIQYKPAFRKKKRMTLLDNKKIMRELESERFINSLKKNGIDVNNYPNTKSLDVPAWG
jgi:hypothetical protein